MFKRIPQLFRRVGRKFKSNHWIYLLLHLVILLVGFLFLAIGRIIDTKTLSVIIFSVGASIIATALAGGVLFLRVWLSQEESNRSEIIRKFGLVEVFERRAAMIKSEYDARLDHVEKYIEIMGFGLKSLRVDYLKDFASWAAKAEVRILLLDPEFLDSDNPIADQRDKEEKNSEGDIRREVYAFISDCASLCASDQLNFEIRLYRCLPSINIFRIDDNLFWGPYLIGDVSRNFPTFLLDRQGTLFTRLLDHFNDIWSNDEFSRPVPSEWFASDFPHESESLS